jgi:phenylacetate-CoA ligase
MTPYFDTRETRDSDERERAIFDALPEQIAHAQVSSAYFAALLKGIDAGAINSRAALAKLPVSRKSELHELQAKMPPFGGLNATAPGGLARIFMSPGPIYDPEGRRPDYWRAARSLHAAGFRAGDVVQNCFSYHLTPAGSMFETGLCALQCAVVPAGVGQTEMQVAVMSDLRVNGYVGTPSFLKTILEKAAELKRDVSTLKKAQVSGEAFLPPQRALFKERGIDCYQAYGTADLGVIAFETSARDGLVMDEDVILEIVRPGTGDPVPDGEVGEVVITTFNRDYPLIRFATGDLSAVLSGVSPCGRTNVRIKGWMGRADQTTKVRGLFVHPHQIAAAMKRVEAVERMRVVVDNPEGNDRMRVLCALSAESRSAADGLRNRIEEAVRDVTKLRGEVEFVDATHLPNDGKVIEDQRRVG